MKNVLILSLLFLLVCSACKKDEEQSFIDQLEDSYTGTMVDFTCSFPQEESAPVNSTAEITKESETEVNVVIKNADEVLFDFQGVITSDTTFMIETFTQGVDTYNGIGKKTDKLEIFLGDGCTFGVSELLTSKFEED